jgi:hypothetical protein
VSSKFEGDSSQAKPTRLSDAVPDSSKDKAPAGNAFGLAALGVADVDRASLPSGPGRFVESARVERRYASEADIAPAAIDVTDGY